MPSLHACLEAENPELERACLFPRYQQLALFAEQHPDMCFADALKHFADRCYRTRKQELPYNTNSCYVKHFFCLEALLIFCRLKYSLNWHTCSANTYRHCRCAN